MREPKVIFAPILEHSSDNYRIRFFYPETKYLEEYVVPVEWDADKAEELQLLLGELGFEKRERYLK